MQVIDESMSRWRPKTTKTGGLPNLFFRPRKPVDLLPALPTPALPTRSSYENAFVDYAFVDLDGSEHID